MELGNDGGGVMNPSSTPPPALPEDHIIPLSIHIDAHMHLCNGLCRTPLIDNVFATVVTLLAGKHDNE